MPKKSTANEPNRSHITCPTKYASPRTCTNFEVWKLHDRLGFEDNSLIPDFVFSSSKFKRSFPTEPGTYLFAYGGGESFLGHTSSLPPHDGCGPYNSQKGAYLSAIYKHCQSNDYNFGKIRDGKSWQIYKKIPFNWNEDGKSTTVKPPDYWAVYFSFVWLSQSDFQDTSDSKASLHRKLELAVAELENELKQTKSPYSLSAAPHVEIRNYVERLLEKNDPHMLISRQLVKEEIESHADILAVQWNLEEKRTMQRVIERCITLISSDKQSNS